MEHMFSGSLFPGSLFYNMHDVSTIHMDFLLLVLEKVLEKNEIKHQGACFAVIGFPQECV